VQARGYNAFSYADVAKAVGIRKASLHYHFATKGDLGVALVERYRRAFLAALGSIEAGSDESLERLERYAELYASVLRRKRMCMCGMLATDAATLPRAMRSSVSEFFTENVGWLSRVLDQGRRRGELRFGGTPASMAKFFVSSLEGAMLVAYGSGNFDSLAGASRQLMAIVRPDRAKTRARTNRRTRAEA
jgi:TetR/AcrR family transcriptional repressor of nem operon